MKFNKGTREAYHKHVFDALTWWLWGSVIEHVFNENNEDNNKVEKINWCPWILPKYTPCDNLHKIEALETSYAISFRGPWKDTWYELKQIKDTDQYEKNNINSW